MTTLEKLLEEKEVTVYGLTKQLGHCPRSMTGYVKKQVRGEVGISPERLIDILNAISKKSKSIVCEDDIKFHTTRIKID